MDFIEPIQCGTDLEFLTRLITFNYNRQWQCSTLRSPPPMPSQSIFLWTLPFTRMLNISTSCWNLPPLQLTELTSCHRPLLILSPGYWWSLAPVWALRLESNEYQMAIKWRPSWDWIHQAGPCAHFALIPHLIL